MARIFLSPLIVDIRNKQSDTVFSKWKGINYIRSRVVPHNPKSVAQIAIRDALAQLVALWQNCYPSVKLNWDKWASGRDYSGFNKFIGKNVVTQRSSGLIDLTQEVGFTKLTVFTIAGGAGGGDLEVTFVPTPVPANTDLEIHIKLPGGGVWLNKTTYPTTTASPQTVSGLPVATVVAAYGYFVKDTAPVGDEVGNDLSESGATT